MAEDIGLNLHVVTRHGYSGSVVKHNITLDRSISRNPAERSAWKESGAIVFFLKKSFVQQTPWDQTAKMVKKWPTICKLAAKAKPGDGFIVHTSGDKIEPIEL